MLITHDLDFADIRNYPPSLYKGILMLRLREGAIPAPAMRVLETFVNRGDWLAHFERAPGDIGRLASALSTGVKSLSIYIGTFTLGSIGCQPASRVVHLNRFYTLRFVATT